MGDIPGYSKIEENQKKCLKQGFSNNLIFQFDQNIGFKTRFDTKAFLQGSVKGSVICSKNDDGQVFFLGIQDLNAAYKSWFIQHKYFTNLNSSTKLDYHYNPYKISFKTNKENHERNYSASIKYKSSEINSQLTVLSTKLMDFWAVKPIGIYGLGFRIGYNYGLKQLENKSIAVWWSDKKSNAALKYLNQTKNSLLKEGIAAYISHKINQSLTCAASLKLLHNHSADIKFVLQYDAGKNKIIKVRVGGNGVFGLNISQKLNDFLEISVCHQFSIKAISNGLEPISNLGIKLEITSKYIDKVQPCFAPNL
ncbi:unnamed protein product [Blepharisma stoltei]|uniref:LAGLIDADG homing endonuclease n=1 Tax=Blepharisma stoltei TaxID=1481888 RepID=A0AAU9IUE7_9CILI|nr:unnamed protein product [Blepharisma stoltei]